MKKDMAVVMVVVVVEGCSLFVVGEEDEEEEDGGVVSCQEGRVTLSLKINFYPTFGAYRLGVWRS